MVERKLLSDILQGNERESLTKQWAETEAADDFAPLPKGEYVAHVIEGVLFTSRTNDTPGYKLTFRVLEGKHEGRMFWSDLWLTAPALPMTKRDLTKLGICSVDQLEQPLPQGICCAVKLALRRSENGSEYNHVRSFSVLRIDNPKPEPFAPKDGCDNETAGSSSTADSGASFDFGHNVVPGTKGGTNDD